MDLIFSPFVLMSCKLLKYIRKTGIENYKISKTIFLKNGIFPIIKHYYEPQFDCSSLYRPLSEDRNLIGIDFNSESQIDLLNSFNYNNELKFIDLEKKCELEYYFHNGSFESGDSEILYSLIRFFKPRNFIEIGSGFSTLMAKKAFNKNKELESDYSCKIVCIEPFEMPWLEKLKVDVIRQRVELLDKNIFSILQSNDILFIDSSHIIKPQGDVLFEFLEILPILNSGVLIHFHDIFSPKDYLDEWICDKHLFWNEQYLLEAFLTYNNNFRIIAALNYLKHNYPDVLFSKCPILNKEPHREPGSFWLIKN